MRRRPVEDDQEEEERRQREVARRSGPADERRHRAGGPADDDVLRGRALELARVDEHVEEFPASASSAARTLTKLASTTKESAESARPNSSARAGATRPEATGRRSVRVRMWTVDVAVEHVVQGAGAAAREGEPAERGGEKA